MEESHLNAFSLEGETALITGGGTGLGFAIARCMAEAGANVIITGRREDVLKKAADKIGNKAVLIAHDITKVADAPGFIEHVTKENGAVTILVNNAGIHIKKAAIETTELEFMDVLTTHVLGSHALSRAVAPGMIQRKKGSILFIVSMTALFGVPLVIAYSAAKSAMIGMMRTLTTELSPSGIRINAIAPGWIESDMMLKALSGDPERSQKIIGRTPMHCFGEAIDIGRAAVYLSSPAAKFVTGIILPVDGGCSIGF